MKKVKIVFFIFISFIINSIQLCLAKGLPLEMGGYYGYNVINPDIIPFLKFWEWGQYLFLGIILISIIILFIFNRKKLNYKKTIICSILGIALILLCLNLKQIILKNNTKEQFGDARGYSFVEIDGNRYYLHLREE